MENTSLEQKTEKYLCPTYARYPLAVKTASGCRLYDFQGREYIDLLAGISVCNLGHSHPEIVQAICSQAGKLVHTSNLFYQEEQVLLSEKLVETCHLDKVFFCNSGAEANEAAIKLMRRYMSRVRGENRHELITFSGSFHGRTLATMTATGQDKIKEGFAPLPEGFRHVPLNDVQALEDAVNENTAAIMAECIQGEGGIKLMSPEFKKKINELQRSRDILLIVDEIQTGMGRTGSLWAFEQEGLEPDMFTSSKALAAGLPMGALLAREEVASAFGPGSHGTTFGGGPLPSVAALKSLEIIQRDGLLDYCRDLGQWAANRFRETGRKCPGTIREVRGRGLMLGIELEFPGKDVWQALLDRGFVLNLTQESVLRLLPPLTITGQDLEQFALALEQVLQKH
ncbi:acetylornithine and succinylornithine aminotransferase [Desulfonatronospira thiodismutans ASO3-1]|uniref:Acetylornithine aminotransferase n=1 Tax=Desulfonatronospira thiodismutans ASO3-1 TaxID=555779 RepID=D6SS26_9BACT|nr:MULTISPECIES: aspartate aminotransferase family protein [Desulfonatronospira]EFI33492.1 acetylornithine and succinylornithine aminotransferase [Desulfonatronospira thiodismutans ASO3-1]RQD74150.1 MAG: aspartate aminotransferase family protein [Desulfonatronospira sp. MSAO_Bac3]